MSKTVAADYGPLGQCEASAVRYTQGGWPKINRCMNSAKTVGADGKHYCQIHSPDAKARREAKKDSRFAAKQEEHRQRMEQAVMAPHGVRLMTQLRQIVGKRVGHPMPVKVHPDELDALWSLLDQAEADYEKWRKK